MLQPNTTKRIGYWLLHLHQLFEESTARTLSSENLNRRQWQVLHAISIKVDTVVGIDDAFAPFLAVDRADSYRSVVDEFRNRGWVTENNGFIALNESGVAAHERVESLINAHASELLAGISETEFIAANDVLARIASNVEKQ